MHFKLFAGAAIGLALIAASPAAAQPADIYSQAVAAPGRTDAMTALDDGRHPAEVLAFMGLEPGDVALDLYAGSGYFSELMARVVGPEGIVVATNPEWANSGDAAAPFEALLERNPNIRVDTGRFLDFDYPENSLDFVMLSMIYHDVYFQSAQYGTRRHHPQLFLAAIYEALKPGGIVGVIDHVAEPGGDTREVVSAVHRIDPAVLRADFERAGFVFDGESEILRNLEDDHSLLVFDPAIRGHTDRVLMRFRKPG